MANLLRTILHRVGSIEQYGILSLCLFCLVFTGVIVWAFAQKKNHLDYMARAALDPDSEDPKNIKDSHE